MQGLIDGKIDYLVSYINKQAGYELVVCKRVGGSYFLELSDKAEYLFPEDALEILLTLARGKAA